MSFDQDFKDCQNVLFIPESPDYPGVDFLIWDLDEKVLLAFQVTIDRLNDRKNADHFTTGDDSPSLQTKWANLCGIDEDNVYFVWIASNSTADKVTNRMPNKLRVSFSNINGQFPALADFDNY